MGSDQRNATHTSSSAVLPDLACWRAPYSPHPLFVQSSRSGNHADSNSALLWSAAPHLIAELWDWGSWPLLQCSQWHALLFYQDSLALPILSTFWCCSPDLSSPHCWCFPAHSWPGAPDDIVKAAHEISIQHVLAILYGSGISRAPPMSWSAHRCWGIVAFCPHPWLSFSPPW